MTVTDPSTIPSPAEIGARAAGLRDLLAANAARSEADRRVPAASIEALTDAGLWRILTPRTYGGWEAGLRAQVEALLAVAPADPAAAWVLLVINAHAWIVGSFPVACQDEVFGAGGPDARVPGTLASQGRARPVEGGWRVGGRWQFASGVDHGDWLLMGTVVDATGVDHGDWLLMGTVVDATGADGTNGTGTRPGTGAELPRALHVVIPKAELTVDDTWYTLGLRGSGSKDLVVDDLFVPAHRAVPTRELFDGVCPDGERHATHFNRLPVITCLSIQLAATVVGIANSALELFVDRSRARRDTYTGGAKADKAGLQMRVAESAAELTTAALLIRAGADRCDEVASSGVALTTDERAELKWHAAYGVELARRATERLYAASGAHAVYDDSALQGRFRDVNTACHHAIVDLDTTAEMYGRTRLGLSPGTPLV